MSNTLEAIHLLKDKLEILLAKYEFLREENEVLLRDNAKLLYLLEEKDAALKSKDEAYKTLKMAKTIEGSNEDKRETKLKINTLIREIDKCINQLNS